MNANNGFFGLRVVGDSTFLVIYPPLDGGKKAELNQITEYLDRNLLGQYQLKEIADALNKMEEQTVLVGAAPVRPYNEVMTVDISLDKMLAFCHFIPPSEGGDMMDYEEIVKQLNSERVKEGIREDEIKRFLKERNYREEYILAKGTPPVQGQDGKIEYLFNIKPNTKPKRNDDGTVNYHELNTVSLVYANDPVACVHKAVEGTDGKNIVGELIKARPVKSVHFEYANNLKVSEDQTQLISQVTGHASLVNGKIFVSDVYEVPADVDNSTGDIDYSGNVTVKGSVKSGFKIFAKGDIIVEGVVEGATLIADGQIIIKQGIHGMTKGVLKAGGNILCKFIENAEVQAGGYIETESILHSTVSAYSEIRVFGRKGFVTGGLIRAGKIVEALIIGSEMGTQTKIEVGMDPTKKERYAKLRQTMEGYRKELDKVKPILATFTEKLNSGEVLSEEKLGYIQKLVLSYKQIQQHYNESNEEFTRLHEELMMSDDAKIKVRKDVYPGVQVTISDISLFVKEHRSFCQFVKKGAEIIVETM